jgi:hypothetical protein
MATVEIQGKRNLYIESNLSMSNARSMCVSALYTRSISMNVSNSLALSMSNTFKKS